MEHFSTDTIGYNKEQVNDFIDYVIKKTEENVYTIKEQVNEIKKLKEELEHYKKLEYSLNYANIEQERINNEKKLLAQKEADLIIEKAKDNASRIVNEALLKANKLSMEKETTNNNIKLLKKKLRTNLLQQLDLIENIETL